MGARQDTAPPELGGVPIPDGMVWACSARAREACLASTEGSLILIPATAPWPGQTLTSLFPTVISPATAAGGDIWAVVVLTAL